MNSLVNYQVIILMNVFDTLVQGYLMVYSRVPFSIIRSSLLGMVMLWATDFFPLWKKVSGVQILLAIRLLRRRMFIGPLNLSRSSVQRWRKNTSTVYSWEHISG